MAQAGYVYIIHGQGTNYIKIGKTTNIVSRLEQLQQGVPFQLQIVSVQLVHDMESAEKELLQKYHEFHKRGEWFELPIEVLAQWALNETLQPLFKDKTQKIPKESEQFTSIQSQRILELFPDERDITMSEIYTLLEAKNSQSRNHIRVTVFRLCNAGIIAKRRRGVFCVPTALETL